MSKVVVDTNVVVKSAEPPASSVELELASSDVIEARLSNVEEPVGGGSRSAAALVLRPSVELAAG